MEYKISSKLADMKPSAIREIFKSLVDPSIIAFAAGNPAPESFPKEDMARISAKVFTDEAVKALQYSITEGYPALREDVVSRLKTKFGIGRDFDTTIIVRQCEGSYYFRDEEYAYTDTFYQTTYWTPSGCDTLWTIDLVTCPHCHYVNDTVSTADMPHRWGGISFGSEVTDYPIYISINDTCDSIIFYTLVVIKHWGEPPLDSTFILVPNIFTPGQETNNRFKIVANKFILEAQVNLFDRRGVKVAEFDGLTGDWDGTHDGIPLPQGSYIYYIRYRDTSVNGWKNLKGTVTLIR